MKIYVVTEIDKYEKIICVTENFMVALNTAKNGDKDYKRLLATYENNQLLDWVEFNY